MNRDTIVRRTQRQIEAPVEDEAVRVTEFVTVEDAGIDGDEIANDVSDMAALWFAPGSYVSPDKPLQYAYPYTPWYYQRQELTHEDLREAPERV